RGGRRSGALHADGPSAGDRPRGPVHRGLLRRTQPPPARSAGRGSRAMSDGVAVFESHRPALLALAYRMLGDLARAEDLVQEAWLRWQGRSVAVDAPQPFRPPLTT